jgi:hypothetical protein
MKIATISIEKFFGKIQVKITLPSKDSNGLRVIMRDLLFDQATQLALYWASTKMPED